MNNNEGFKITAHRPANPFAGKKFKVVTYQGDKELASQAITCLLYTSPSPRDRG